MQIPRMQTRAAQTIQTENTVTANLQKQVPIRTGLTQQEQQNYETLQDLKVQAAITGFNTIASLAQTFAGEVEKQQKKAFRVEKAANLASALITTYNSANKAYNSQFLPLQMLLHQLEGQ